MCLQESFERVAISTANAIINQVCMRMPRKKRKMSIKADIKIKLRIHIHDAINFIWIVLNINIHNISIAIAARATLSYCPPPQRLTPHVSRTHQLIPTHTCPPPANNTHTQRQTYESLSQTELTDCRNHLLHSLSYRHGSCALRPAL